MILALVLILGSALREPAPSPPYVLTSALRSRLKTEALAPVSRVEDLPPAVKEALRVLFKADSLEMAEPNQEFQSTDVVLGPPIGHLQGRGRHHRLLLVGPGASAGAGAG